MTSGKVGSTVFHLIVCKSCSKEFKVTKDRLGVAKYCSRLCKNKVLPAIIKECLVCKESFEAHSNNSKYCSPECYHAVDRKNRGFKVWICLECKVEFRDSPSHPRKYCSRLCTSKSRMNKFEAQYSTVRSMMIRRGMFKKCETCGYDEDTSILGAHHKDRNRHNNAIENLAVLCPNCHSRVHKKHIVHGGVKGNFIHVD